MFKTNLKKKLTVLLTVFIWGITMSGCSSSPTLDTTPPSKDQTSSKYTPTLPTQQPSPESAQIVQTQFDGSQVILKELPESICAHSYALALILHDLGLNITSIMSTSRPLPEALKALPTIGTPQNPDYELIKSYNTDFLISSSTFKESTEKFLKEQGIAACYLDITLYSDTRRNIEILGKAFSKTTEMNDLLEDIDQREQAVLNQINAQQGKTIAIIMGTGKSFLFNTEKSYVGEMTAMMGLENIVKSSKKGESTISFSTELLVQLDPDIILRYAHGSNWEDVNASFESSFSENNAFANLNAVKNGNVYDLDAELFTANAGTRSIESFETLAKTLFGLE